MVAPEQYVFAKGKRQGKRQGKAEGLEQGMQKGKAEGLEQGMQTGKAEGIEHIALKMLKKQLNLSVIAEMTGLSLKKLKQLNK